MKKKKPMTDAQRQKRRRDKKKESDLKEVRVWVPPESTQVIKDLAQQLTK